MEVRLLLLEVVGLERNVNPIRNVNLSVNLVNLGKLKREDVKHLIHKHSF